MFASLLAFVAAAAAVKGIDINLALTASQASCFVSQGYQFVILRGWHCGSATPDTASITSYAKLRAAGMPHVGFYLFPCVGPSCPSATSQVNNMAQFITSHNMVADSVWLDIETPASGQACFWHGTSAQKRAFYTELVAAGLAQWGSLMGIYSSRAQWYSVMGSYTFVNAGDGPLRMWYARYNNEANFDDWSGFSVWSKPYAKQYIGDGKVCSVDVDVNYAAQWVWDGNVTLPPIEINQPAAPVGPFQPPVVSCTDSTAKPGYCTDSATCNSYDGTLHSSSSGAVGCGKLAQSIQCCTNGTFASGAGALPPALQTCTYTTKTTTGHGSCLSQTTCHQVLGTSRTSGSGAKGCESFPTAIQCCVAASASLLQDGLDANGDSLSPAGNNVGVYVGAVIAVIAVIAIVLVGVVCVLRHRKATGVSYGNEVYATSSPITMSPDAIKGTAPQFL